MVQTGISRPRLLVGGAHSGVGKSSITLALVAALRKRGLKVQTFKVGPDYLDPGHLAMVSGRPCYNLDGWMTSRSYLRDLFLRVSEDADLCLVEGVMGLFDGSGSDSLTGSSAEIAAWLDIPVALVVNTHGMARSIAALVSGYNNFDPQVTLAGILANRCGSVSHAELLRKSLNAAGLPPLLGAVGRGALPELTSRHLGLVSAPEQRLNDEMIDQLAAAAEQDIALDLLLEKAHQAPCLVPDEHHRVTAAERQPDVRLAVARDEAFQFYYADLFPALRERGCEPVFFSPLHDNELPPDIAGLYLGGGYPEIHAEKLAQNHGMLKSVAAFCAGGRPVYAECGGLIYLSRGVETDAGFFELTGCLPVRTRMLERRKALGYVTATLTEDSLFGSRGDCFRGHEFHYSELLSSPDGCGGWRAVYQLRQNRSGRVSSEGFCNGNVLASYAHLHLASQPQAIDRFVARLRKQAGQPVSGVNKEL